eukprot:c19032_g1_i3 orf=176-1552(+)
MQSKWRTATFLGSVWVASLLYGEMLAFWIPVWSCTWPTLNSSLNDSKADSNDPIKVAVIADPQLTDRTTHGLAPGSFVLRVVLFYSDIYMRRSFRTSVLALEPDEIIFLGDYFDGGPYLSNEEYHESWKRFQHIFDQSQRGARSRSSMIRFHFLSGNHDLGYGGLQSARPEVIERYEKLFGETVHTDHIGGVDFIFVDAQALDGPTADARTSNTWNFIQNLSTESNHPPRVLLSHIPLYRPNDTPCGIDRSSPVINQRITWSGSGSPGILYQNYLTEEITVRLLHMVKPVLVLSGHDHDQCTVRHRASFISVLEHTLGSFSWQAGNHYPSFMLLSVASSTSKQSVEGRVVSSQLCFLPYQTFIYIWYAILFVVSVLLLFGLPLPSPNWKQYSTSIRQFVIHVVSSRPNGEVKEKEEDVDCEYEMVWDAEGAMHLIKKCSSHTLGHRDGSSFCEASACS